MSRNLRKDVIIYFSEGISKYRSIKPADNRQQAPFRTLDIENTADVLTMLQFTPIRIIFSTFSLSVVLVLEQRPEIQIGVFWIWFFNKRILFQPTTHTELLIYSELYNVYRQHLLRLSN